MELLLSKSMSWSIFDVDSSMLIAVTIFTKITSIANIKNRNMQMARFVYCEYVKMKLLFCWWWWKMLLLCRFEAISLIFGSTTLTNDCTGPIKRNKRCAIFNDYRIRMKLTLLLLLLLQRLQPLSLKIYWFCGFGSLSATIGTK